MYFHHGMMDKLSSFTIMLHPVAFRQRENPSTELCDAEN